MLWEAEVAVSLLLVLLVPYERLVVVLWSGALKGIDVNPLEVAYRTHENRMHVACLCLGRKKGVPLSLGDLPDTYNRCPKRDSNKHPDRTLFTK